MNRRVQGPDHARLQRGAALVEAVAAIPFFVAMLAALLYVVALYSEKVRALRQARQAAWTHALGGCEGNAAVSSTDANALAQLSAQGESAHSSLDRYARSAGGAQVLDDFGVAKATATGSVRAEPILGAVSSGFSWTVRVQCNERPRNGDLAGTLRYGWDQIRF